MKNKQNKNIGDKMKNLKNTLTIRLDDELLDELKKLADKEYRPLALQIRKMLSEAIKRETASGS